ncbi:MAG: alpha-glucuronidase [Clostridiales bacterium]|nr:alpha-glucuronidase [Clostridiales bacterium]
MNHDTRLCWLPFLKSWVEKGPTDCMEMARAELSTGLAALDMDAPVLIQAVPDADEGYEILTTNENITIRGGKRGVLYGAYALMMRLAAGFSPETPWTEPACPLRMLNHWDNMDGSIERGYAGGSFFFRDHHLKYDEQRILQYGRLLASVGINVVSINNVNVHSPAGLLITQTYLPELKQVADLLRPFGIRLLVAVDYALPVTYGLGTADPVSPQVQEWWKRQVSLVYQYIPDLCGFLVKADSEFRPGPHMYQRNHAEGAQPLARALKPHGGVLLWRCFVYNCKQDWRDAKTDRPMAPYEIYTPLEGQFDDNVILQIKNGPYDFQVREPVSPLFFAMPTTNKAIELQLTQEYTGQQIDLFYMPPQWQEIQKTLGENMPKYISAVSNLGDDPNWTGHDLAQANLFAYGLFAWHRNVDPAVCAQWWTRLTFGPDASCNQTIVSMLLSSREIYESYNTPLGLCWMVNPNNHYGPSPEGYEYSGWGTYLRANRDAIGVDRTTSGTGFILQYPEKLAAQYNRVETCPEQLLLFFHRLRYNYRLPSGKTLVQHVYDSHFSGAEQAKALLCAWQMLKGKIPQETYTNVEERLMRQVSNACEWRDVINTYFFRYSGIPDEHGRVIYP